MQPARIRSHYLKSWFCIDLVSILPFDSVSLATQNDKLSQMMAVRLIRLLRLAKLARILRAGRMFKRWEMSIPISYAWQGLYKFVVRVVVCAHWIACCWRMVLQFEDKDEYADSWLSNDNANGARPHHVFVLYVADALGSGYTSLALSWGGGGEGLLHPAVGTGGSSCRVQPTPGIWLAGLTGASFCVNSYQHVAARPTMHSSTC